MMALLVVWAAPSLAQETGEAPRVTGQDDAAEATIIVNEVNADDYPDVRIFATVLQDGEPLTGLTAEDFRVREDEVDQEPLIVEPQLPPLSVVVTLDSSGSMARRLTETQAAARQFVESLGDNDSAQLVSFAREIRTLTPMTSTTDSVLQAIDGITARGDTALYDALYQSVDLLAERRGRRAVVLLSDGVDDDGTGRPLSERTIRDVLDRAADVGVPIFVIGLGTEMDEAVLADIALTTGALYLNAPETSELAAVYGQISDQLTGQYSIRYTSNLPADGTQRRVDLMALGRQDSRSYTPEGTEAAAAPAAVSAPLPSPAAECPLAEAAEAERPELQQAVDRYGRGLIGRADRDVIRQDIMERLEQAFSAPVADLTCARDGLAAILALYDDNLITRAARDTLRQRTSTQISSICSAVTTQNEHVECLTFFRDAYGESLITRAARDTLRADAFERLLDLLAEAPEFDEDMTLVGSLYSANLITSADRRLARTRLLEAER